MIEKYLKLKKREFVVKSLIGLLVLSRAVSCSVRGFNQNMLFHEMQIQGTFLAIILANKWM